MHYLLSNTADRQTIETEFGVPFKYPGIYQKNPIINGLRESIVPVLTMQNDRELQFAIWGILPENFKADWSVFQAAQNSLNLGREAFLESGEWYSSAFEQRRCLIIATGFITFHLHKGDTYPYYVYDPWHRPISFAGIYNQLEDGFITCALMVTGADKLIRKIQNIEKAMPMVVAPDHRETWLNPETSRQEIARYIWHPPEIHLSAHPISREFIGMNKAPLSVLTPVPYSSELPLVS